MKHNYSKMTDEELMALMEATDDAQTREAINAELEKRETGEAAGPVESTEHEAEAEAAPAEAENTDLDELLKKCQANIGHKCKVVPAGTIEYADGVIVGCLKVKRNGTVAYAIKLDNGKRVVKNYKAPLFEILDEVVDNLRVHNRTSVKQERWPLEKMQEEVAKYIGNVGRAIIVKDADGNDITGRITGIVPVSRSNSILYRVTLPAADENAKPTIVHKSVVNIDTFTICEADEESEQYNSDYINRRNGLSSKVTLTGHELVLDLELKLEKAKAAVEKATERVNALTEALEKARENDAEGTESAGNTEEENML